MGLDTPNKHNHTLVLQFLFVVTIYRDLIDSSGPAGSIVDDRTAAGILLMLGGIFSLSLFLGFFGVSFILSMLVGALALSKK